MLLKIKSLNKNRLTDKLTAAIAIALLKRNNFLKDQYKFDIKFN
jgi:hypothetical protein